MIKCTPFTNSKALGHLSVTPTATGVIAFSKGHLNVVFSEVPQRQVIILLTRITNVHQI